MFKGFDRKAKTAPSEYPRVLFHGIRCFQLVSSLIVGGIMCYFIWHLTHDNYKAPWTFIFLTASSLASIAALTFTIFLHCCTGLHPRFNMILNSLLCVLWAVSWSLLTWYMSGTLANMCDISHWNEDVGIMVCRIYKALFTFTLLAFLSTIAATVLDIYVHRKQTSRGIYRLHDIDNKRRSQANEPFFDGQGYGQSGLAAPRESGIWEEPRRSMGPYSEQSENLVQQEDYDRPQSGRDTGYHGAQPSMG